MIYLIPLLLIILGCLKYDRPLTKNKGAILWGLIYIVLILIFGLRYKVGGDTYNYMDYFLNSPDIQYWEPFDFSGFELGFSAFTSLIRTYTDNIYVYQTIIAACTTFMLMSFAKKNTEYKFLAMLLIYIAMYPYFCTEVVRESLAIGGVLLSYHLIEEKKYIKYWLICSILLTLHTGVLICFLFPLIKFLRFDKSFPLWAIVFIISGFCMAKLMEDISDFYIFHKLSRYYMYTYVGYLWCGLRFLYFSILPMCTLIFCKSRLGIHCKYENIICFQIILGLGIWFVPIVFQRLINYTIIFYLVSTADVIGKTLRDNTLKTKISSINLYYYHRYAILLLIVTIMAHFTYYIHVESYKKYIPYHSIFDPIDEPMREKFVSGQD